MIAMTDVGVPWAGCLWLDVCRNLVNNNHESFVQVCCRRCKVWLESLEHDQWNIIVQTANDRWNIIISVNCKCQDMPWWLRYMNNVMSFYCCSWCTAGLDWSATKLLRGHNDPGTLMHTAAGCSCTNPLLIAFQTFYWERARHSRR